MTGMVERRRVIRVRSLVREAVSAKLFAGNWMIGSAGLSKRGAVADAIAALGDGSGDVGGDAVDVTGDDTGEKE